MTLLLRQYDRTGESSIGLARALLLTSAVARLSKQSGRSGRGGCRRTVVCANVMRGLLMIKARE